MKAERRQQLRTNELAQTLADLVEYCRNNSGVILGVAAAVVLVLSLGAYWYATQVSARTQGWEDFAGSQMAGEGGTGGFSRDKIREVAVKYKSQPVLASMAWLRYADASVMELRSGRIPPAEVQKALSDAVSAYNSVLNHYPEQTISVAGARFGLANLAEMQGRFGEAKTQYEAVVSDSRFAEMPYKSLAVEAINRLAVISQPVVFVDTPTTEPSSRPVALSPVSRPAVSSAPAGVGGTTRAAAVPNAGK